MVCTYGIPYEVISHPLSDSLWQSESRRPLLRGAAQPSVDSARAALEKATCTLTTSPD
jgi:hypothetical protein